MFILVELRCQIRPTSSQSIAVSGLIDIGLNLTHDSFAKDRTELLLAARDAGVARCIVTGSSIAASRSALALAQAYPGQLYATAGVHPHHATELSDDQLDALRTLSAAQEVVAVGECGLDFFRNFSPRADQESAFRLQLDLAAEVAKPVFLHQRDAHAEFLALLRPRRDSLVGGVAHCFTGGPAEALDYLELDLYIGITGWLCDPQRGTSLREAVPQIPLERLLLETDAPYLLPKDLAAKPRNRRNEPKFLPHILDTIASLRDESVEELAFATRRNTERLFNLPPG